MKRVFLIAVVCSIAAACGHRGAEPSTDEYAVWSAAADAAFAGELHTFALYPEPEIVVPRMEVDDTIVATLRFFGVAEEVTRSFAARNHVRVPVRAAGFSTRRVRVIASMPRWMADALAGIGVVDGMLSVSRVGFSRDGRRAVVAVGASCGSRCGRGALLQMERGRDGRWHRTGEILIWRS